jgi:biotin carboxyl carrier protein
MAHGGAPGATTRPEVKYQVSVDAQSFEIEVDHDWLVWVNGHPLYIDLEQVGGLSAYSLAVEDRVNIVFVEQTEGEYRVEVGGQIYSVRVHSQHPRLAPPQVESRSGEGEGVVISAPLAGTLVSLSVEAGDQVKAGQVVAVVESMKMKMELKTPQNGVVEGLYGPTGRGVDQGEKLVVLGPE